MLTNQSAVKNWRYSSRIRVALPQYAGYLLVSPLQVANRLFLVRCGAGMLPRRCIVSGSSQRFSNLIAVKPRNSPQQKIQVGLRPMFCLSSPLE